MPLKFKKYVRDKIKTDFILIQHVADMLNKSPFTVRDYLLKGKDAEICRFDVIKFISNYLNIKEDDLFQ